MPLMALTLPVENFPTR